MATNTILIKRSAVAAKVPSTTDLQLGEIAINTYDGKMYIKKNNGTDSVVQVGPPEALSGLTDVNLTSPTTGQVLYYNGSVWVNNATTPSSYSTVISSWTLVSGNIYYADVTHNLGTQNVVVSLFDNSTNALIQADSVVLTSTNTVTVKVAGNTRQIRIVIVANGLTVVGSGAVTSVAGKTGAVTLVPSDITGLTSIIPPLRTFTYFPASLDSPNNADWAVNALAPTVTDPNNIGLNVRQFSNTVEQGVGCYVSIPLGATNLTFYYKGRAQTAPGTTASIQPKLYVRSLPNNGPISSWNLISTLGVLSVPTNNYFQYYSQTVTLASLSLTPGTLYQFEFTRNNSVSGNLASNWLLSEISLAFT
jgi:hypothetical protein